LVIALLVVSGFAWRTIDKERQDGQVLALLSRAASFHMSADEMHDALRADVNAALRSETETTAAAAQVLASIRENTHQFQANVDALERLELPQDLEQTFEAVRDHTNTYIALANDVVKTAINDRQKALELEQEFNASFDDLLKMNYDANVLLSNHFDKAERESLDDALAGKLLIVIASVATGLIALTCVAVLSGSIRGSLRQVSDAARALAAGNFSVRSEVASEDEVGELAGALNKMADDLQSMIDRLLAEADRDAFTTQLMQALEMADNELDIYGVVRRAMTQVNPSLAMELLISDANKTSLQRVAAHPDAGPAGCGVESLANCVAVRRGAALQFDDSDALNACPKLRGRSPAAICGVCVPVSFMGRSFGVLHAATTGPKPPIPQQVAELSALGAQAGARIGTVRAFARTQLHAYTDALTGLSNRRALEQTVHELQANGMRYAFALADLDHFKRVNDAHGHEAGDKALRQFADVLRNAVRQTDHAARWGGEEFAVLFVDADVAQALEVVERVRRDLAAAIGEATGPWFTCSFGIGDSSMVSSFEELLRITDNALYNSKDQGRDRATIAGAALSPAASAPTAARATASA
jgi:diguanylate cyclase (GGDEF)-like protein